MGASFSSAWLLKGHFDLSNQDPRNTTTLAIRASLCDALRLPKDGLGIFSYPPGPLFRHTFWWREGRVDYAETQFVAAISNDHPVLSLGVSVEKGLEGNTAVRPEQVMDRHLWDWPRLVGRLGEVLSTDVPGVAADRPVHLRVRRGLHADSHRRWWQTRAFSFVSGQWFERHAGRVHVDAGEVVDHVREVHARGDLWAIVTFTHELAPADVEGMAPSEAAAMLLRFDGIRRRLRA